MVTIKRPITSGWAVRHARAEDMQAMVDIDRESGNAFPWSATQFEAARRTPKVKTAVVVSKSGRIDGFMVYEKKKRSYRIMHIAVRLELQRLGVGRMLVASLSARARQSKRKWATVSLPEVPVGPLVFFRANGFRWVRTVRKRWILVDGDLDAYVLRAEL